MTSSRKHAVTHDGRFHADDVLTYTILSCLGMIGSLTRTRCPDSIARADLVFDVGGTYNPERGRFDHHQRGGAGCRNNGVPYASLGLVWKHYGIKYCAPYANQYDVDPGKLAEAIDTYFIQGIDAMDTFSAEGGYHLIKSGSHVEVLNISRIIEHFNPLPLLENPSASEFDTAFHVAAQALGTIFNRVVLREAAILKSAGIIQKASEAQNEASILVLLSQCLLSEYLERNDLPHRFIVSPDQDRWRCQAVSGSDKSTRFPESWAGLEDKELQNIAEVPDACFCHNAGHLCIAQSKDGAIALAKRALSLI
jgi:uncharacterized UPF0160 family protein